MNRLTFEERKRANKIRCKLLYTIDRDIRQSKKNHKKQILINSMSLKEIEDKFLLFPNYKIKISTTFTKTANKYLVMKTVDNKTKKIIDFTDVLQDKNKVNYNYAKLERKKASANNIIKIPFLADTQEMQSPLPEIFTNKMNIGEKKLIKPEEKITFSYSRNSICKTQNEFYEGDNNKIENKKLYANKHKEKNIINDDSSVYSLTLELIQKKANNLSTTLSNKDKKEIKRRKMQLEAIKYLRHFCFTNLRNKRGPLAKSSHPNLLVVNKKLDEEEEKNNSESSSNEKYKNSKKIKNRSRSKSKSKNNSKKRNEMSTKSKKKKNTVIVRMKDKKKIMLNSTGKKISQKDSGKKNLMKLKINSKKRKSYADYGGNLLREKFDENLLKFKKKKKEIIDTEKNNNHKEEDLLNKNKQNLKLKRKPTGILKDSFKGKNNNKNIYFINQPKVKNKNNIVIINEFNNITKRTCSANNYSIKWSKSRQFSNLFSTKNIIKSLKHLKVKEHIEKTSKSDKHRRFSIPYQDHKNLSKIKNRKHTQSEKSIIFINHFEDSHKRILNTSVKKGKKNGKKFRGRNTQIFNIDKIKIKSAIHRVEEELY